MRISDWSSDVCSSVRPYYRRIATGARDGVSPDHVVILFPYPATARDIGRTHKLQQVGRDISIFGNVFQCFPLWRRDMGPVVAGCIVSQRSQRNVADRLALMVKDHAASARDSTDTRQAQFPL